MVCTIYKIIFASLVALLLIVQPTTSDSFKEEGLISFLVLRLDNLERKIQILEQKNAEQDEEIIHLKNANSKLGKHSDELSTKTIEPSSCEELATNGHSSDGFYLVKNLDSKKIEAVACSFGTTVLQKFVGNVQVKTKMVYFYVQQQNSSFSEDHRGVISFKSAKLNEGGAMDPVTGTFTAPVPGIYKFEFTAVFSTSRKNILRPKLLIIFLNVNGWHAYVASSSLPTDTDDSLSLSSSLRLKKGDKVTLSKSQQGDLDFYDHHQPTHFSGWLVEEDLV